MLLLVGLIPRMYSQLLIRLFSFVEYICSGVNIKPYDLQGTLISNVVVNDNFQISDTKVTWIGNATTIYFTR